MDRKQWCLGVGFSFLASGKGRFALVFAGQKGTEEAENPPVSANADLLGTPGSAPQGAASVRTRGQQCQSHPPPGNLQPPTTPLPEVKTLGFHPEFLSRHSLYNAKEAGKQKKNHQPFDPFPCQKAQCCLPESGAAGYQGKLKPFLLLLL